MTNQFKEILEERKLRCTAIRLLVLKTLGTRSAATSLIDRSRMVKESHRTTLYRTLKIFEVNNLVHRIDDGTPSPKYAANINLEDKEDVQEQHPHFHCGKCEQTYCLNKLPIPEIEAPKGFKKTETSLIINGTCPECSIQA